MAGKQASKVRCTIKAVALGVSLVFSALLTAATLRSPDLHWLAWFSFLPLFVAVRSLRPMMAALSGGLWGACLYVFTADGPTSEAEALAAGIGPSAWLLGLLIVIPAVYMGLAARPARSIAFKLLTLALGWTLVEAVLHPFHESGSSIGLTNGSEGNGPQLHWLARLFGYVSAAFLVACANASLVGIVSGAHPSFPANMSLDGVPNIVGWRRSPEILPIQCWTIYQAHPRAPPTPVAVPTWNLAGRAH